MSDSARSSLEPGAAELFSRESRRREEALSAFEEAWFRGESPEPADFLPDKVQGRQSLLPELLQIDLEFRLKRGEPARVESYLQRYPEIAVQRQSVLDLIAAEFELRRRSEPDLSPDEYRVRFPEFARDLHLSADPGSAPAAPKSVAITIRVIDGEHRGLEYACDRHETVLVGRAKQAQMRLNRDRHFSRFHFRLEIAPPACYLTDLDSRNGTLVNGERVKRAFLKHGDVISGGNTKIAVTFTSRQVQSQQPGCSEAAGLLSRGERRLPNVPGYELLEQVGSGSMGRVYRAVQLASGQTVAVKIVAPAHAHDHEATRLFIREATLLSQLNHPGIVRLDEIGLAEGLPFLAMEFVDSVPHMDVLGSVAEEARTRIACGIICRVLDALGHAHMQSLVHRDVKPTNILLAREGRKLQVKLADFGLARNYLVAGLSSITQDGDLRGTIAYMPPEQILDCRYAKPACDLYAAGVTLYHYLSGTLPFEFGPDRSHFAVVLNDEPMPLERHCPALPPELVAVVYRAIAKDRGERFLTAHEMREALLPFTRR